MITKITMRGIKGANTDQPLTGRDIITGHNGAGKTTRVQALGLSLLGYVPGNGKLAAETLKLASDKEMTVGLATETFEFTRTFGKRGAVAQQTITLNPPYNEKSNAEKEKRIEEELGKLPIMLDFNEFLSLSDTKRREFIYELAENGGTDKGAIINRLREMLSEIALNPQKEEIFESDLAECANAFPDDATVQQGLKAMSDCAKDMLSYWKKERDKAVGAAQKMSEYKNDLTATDRDLEQNREKLAGILEELQTISGQIAAAETRASEKERIQTRSAELHREIDFLKNTQPETPPDQIRALIEQYSADIKEVDNKSPILIKQAELNTSRNWITNLTNKQNDNREKYYAEKSKKDANITLLEKLNNSNGVCAIDCRIKCEKDFSDFKASLESEINETNRRMEEIIAAGAKIKEEYDATTERIASLEHSIQMLQDEEIDARKENAALQDIIADLNRDLASAENFETDRAARIATMQSELDGLENAENSPVSNDNDLGGLITRRDELKRTASEINAKIDEQTKTRNTLAAMKNSIVDRTEAETHVEILKAISDAVGAKGLQGELVKGALQPLTDEIQLKLAQMGVGRGFQFITNDDKGKEIFQFGWYGDTGSFRNFDALSTGEQMLLLIAMMTTIIERMNPPLKVLVIDNAENLDRGNLQRVLSGLKAAGEKLDNIIFCGVFDIDPADAEGWNVCRLGAASNND